MDWLLDKSGHAQLFIYDDRFLNNKVQLVQNP